MRHLFSLRNLAAIFLVAMVAVWLIARQESRALRQSIASDNSTLASPTTVIAAPGGVTNASVTQKPFAYAEALDAVLLETDPVKRTQDFGLLLARWYAENPEAALAYVREMKRDREEYTVGMIYVLNHIADHDPARALQLAAEMATSTRNQYIYNMLFNTIALRDAPSAVNYLSLVPVGPARDNAILSLTAIWSRRDVEGALQWAQSLHGSAGHDLALQTVLLELADKDPARALTLASNDLPRGAANSIAAAAMHQLVRTDVSAAQSMYAQLPDGSVKNDAGLEIARALATTDMAAAFEWRLTLPESRRQTALNLALDVLNQQDPAAAQQFVTAMPAGEEQLKTVAHLARTMTANDPATAIAWEQSLPDGDVRDEAIKGLVGTWINRDHQSALQWTSQLAAADPAKSPILSNAITYWGMIDGNATTAFVKTLPEADQQKWMPLIHHNLQSSPH